MDDHPHATDNAIDQTEQEFLISTVSDEALEKAACGTSCAQTYPQTCVLSGQTPNARGAPDRGEHRQAARTTTRSVRRSF